MKIIKKQSDLNDEKCDLIQLYMLVVYEEAVLCIIAFWVSDYKHFLKQQCPPH